MTQAYGYQEQGIDRIARSHGRHILADEVGLGKTFQALGYYVNHLYPDGPVVVVCPANIKWNWQREASKHFNLRAEVLEGSKAPRSTGYLPRKTIYILNYDILHGWVKWLRALDPVMIIGDEGQRIRNPGAKRTRAFRRLSRGIPHVVFLTGTPITNLPVDIWTMLNILKPRDYPSIIDFGVRYSNADRQFGQWVFKGANEERLPELHDKVVRGVIYDGETEKHITPIMTRRRKCDVLKDLPKKTRIIVPVDIEDRKQYTHALCNFIDWMRKYNPKNASAAERAQRLVQVSYLKRLAAKLKMKSIIEWIEDFHYDSDGKLIVFGIHKAILQPLHERFPKSVLVDGSVTGIKRQHAVDQFTNDPKTRDFYGNMIAAGVGWNGVAASTSLTVELPWEPATVNQCEGRLDRIGQKSAISCYYLVAKGTIEEQLCEIVQRKQVIADTIVDGSVDVSGLGVFNELVDSILRKGTKP